jgi:hypothetical protein
VLTANIAGVVAWQTRPASGGPVGATKDGIGRHRKVERCRQPKQQRKGSVRNSDAVTRRDAMGYGQHFWRPA